MDFEENVKVALCAMKSTDPDAVSLRTIAKTDPSQRDERMVSYNCENYAPWKVSSSKLSNEAREASLGLRPASSAHTQTFAAFISGVFRAPSSREARWTRPTRSCTGCSWDSKLYSKFRKFPYSVEYTHHTVMLM